MISRIKTQTTLCTRNWSSQRHLSSPLERHGMAVAIHPLMASLSKCLGSRTIFLSLNAMEGAAMNAIDTALLKAKSALRWRRPTSETNKMVRSGENLAPTFMNDFPQPGALPMRPAIVLGRYRVLQELDALRGYSPQRPSTKPLQR